jgi:uncharacterized damage-inducible protein DinB
MMTPHELLQELEQEADATRRVLARIPDAELGWKPHPRSFSLGQLALHVAVTPGSVAEMATKSPVSPPALEQPEAGSRAQLLTTLDDSVRRARAVLSAMRSEDLDRMWRVVDGEREVASMPVGALLRSVMLNHWYHHRGQLVVYLRMIGVPVPPVYGPTADENPFAGTANVMAG